MGEARESGGSELPKLTALGCRGGSAPQLALAQPAEGQRAKVPRSGLPAPDLAGAPCCVPAPGAPVTGRDSPG